MRAACLKLDLAFAGIGLDVVEPFQEVDVPRDAAGFAVGNQLQPGRFLLGDDVGDFAVFDRVESLGINFVARPPLARGFECRCAQETADMIGAKRWGSALGHWDFSSSFFPPPERGGRASEAKRVRVR